MPGGSRAESLVIGNKRPWPPGVISARYRTVQPAAMRRLVIMLPRPLTMKPVPRMTPPIGRFVCSSSCVVSQGTILSSPSSTKHGSRWPFRVTIFWKTGLPVNLSYKRHRASRYTIAADAVFAVPTGVTVGEGEGMEGVAFGAAAGVGTDGRETIACPVGLPGAGICDRGAIQEPALYITRRYESAPAPSAVAATAVSRTSRG